MSPKARHTPQEQEELIINAAIECIEETSLLDFTMAAIGKKAEVSMGTIYKHMQSKEDVIVAIGVRMLKKHHRIYSDILRFPLTMPERLICGYLATPTELTDYSFGVQLEMLCSSKAVLQRASKRWVDGLVQFDHAIANEFQQALRDSYESGEIVLSEEDAPSVMESLSMGLWAMCVGFTQVAYQRNARQGDGLAPSLPFLASPELPYPMQPEHGIVKSAHRFLNSFPWKHPLDAAGINRAIELLEQRGYR
ncbi:TetR/AcrR family transcriptional regulator [Pleionea sp. CnH1-48]|uniref:TetR/AcrR family transcriptional regulator n=1 Tax=Pleionea sp. CnH1-48 TaxID=2954494 RepID=UPI002096DE5D|nr:TetR/AcrR family transcriptional regulator [Pleionea sp. CnH1-48]MCO7223226.1 TetR/AcrR family transcriptional regulator [Pleionea sp. CnH1-48]